MLGIAVHVAIKVGIAKSSNPSGYIQSVIWFPTIPKGTYVPMYVYIPFEVLRYKFDENVEFALHKANNRFLRFGGSSFAFFYAYRPATSMDKVITRKNDSKGARPISA